MNAVIKRYPLNTKPNHIVKTTEHMSIYELMMDITDGDHEISSDAASWCELASVGEVYEFREGEIEIMEKE